MYFFLLSYSILGAGIKYIDDAFDEKTFNKKLAIIFTPILSIIGAYAMLIDSISATILFAILCGVLIKGKVDNYAFIAGFIMVIAIVLLAGVQFLIIPLIFLASAAVLDEVGNDYIDNNKKSLNWNKISHKFVIYFFTQRWMMKVALIFLTILNVIPFYFLTAMIFFDYSYLTVNLYSQIKRGTASQHTIDTLAKIGYIFK